MSLRIGSVELKSNLLLCPMAGYTDVTFREIIRGLGGVGLAFTEFVNPREIQASSRRTMEMVERSPADEPLSIQLYGTDADELADAAVWAAELGSVTVDINFGCPVPKVAGKGGGSGVLRNCPDAVHIAATVARRCPVPVTVKTRLGWEMGDLVAPDLARRLVDVGVQAITIHGRYGMQKFAGGVDLAGIRAVVQAVPEIPVIGNGDIKTPQDAKQMIDETGCAGVMIGRQTIGDLWICHQTDHFLRHGVIPPPPSRLDRTLKMVEHFEVMVRRRGPTHAVIDFRKRIAQYAKRIGPCPHLRRTLPYVKTLDEWHAVVDPFVDELRHEEQDHNNPTAMGNHSPAVVTGA